MTKVLHVMNNLHRGGIEKFVLNVNQFIGKDVIFDYFILTSVNHQYVKEIKQLNGRIIDSFVAYCDQPLKQIRLFWEMNYFLKQNQYDVIHLHDCMGMVPILLAAKNNEIPIRIAHSHNAYSDSFNPSLFSMKSKIMIEITKKSILQLGTHLLGCSEDACQRLFGNVKDSRKVVIYNGIDLTKFTSVQKSDSNILQFCHVGRFCKQKNQLFMLQVFQSIVKDKSAHLTIIGFGELEQDIRQKVIELGLEAYVTFLPGDSNVSSVLKEMDYFLLPSLYEGLGIVLIEAQVSNVKCFASTDVPKEAQLGLCEFISLEKSTDEWADEIIRSIERKDEKKLNPHLVQKYDIKQVAEKLKSIYQSGGNDE